MSTTSSLWLVLVLAKSAKTHNWQRFHIHFQYALDVLPFGLRRWIQGLGSATK